MHSQCTAPFSQCLPVMNRLIFTERWVLLFPPLKSCRNLPLWIGTGCIRDPTQTPTCPASVCGTRAHSSCHSQVHCPGATRSALLFPPLPAAPPGTWLLLSRAGRGQAGPGVRSAGGQGGADRVMKSRKVTNKQTAPPGHGLSRRFLDVQGHVYFPECPEPILDGHGPPFHSAVSMEPRG